MATLNTCILYNTGSKVYLSFLHTGFTCYLFRGTKEFYLTVVFFKCASNYLGCHGMLQSCVRCYTFNVAPDVFNVNLAGRVSQLCTLPVLSTSSSASPVSQTENYNLCAHVLRVPMFLCFSV